MSARDRLDSILRLRKLREEQARADVTAASRDEARAAELVRSRRAATSETPAPRAPLPPEVMLSMHLRGLRSHELVELAEQEHARTVERRREVQRRLQQVSVERRSLEKLVERRSAEALAARRAAADRALDELVTLQHRAEEPA